MSFPSGPGYPQQGGGAQPGPQAPGTGGFGQAGPAQPPAQPAPSQASQGIPMNPGVLASLVTTVLGLVAYFLSFSSEASGTNMVVTLLLVGGLLAALRLLPNGPKVLPFAAVISVAGGLTGVSTVVGAPAESTVPGIVVVLLIVGILQLLAAVAALLFEYKLLKVPAPKPQQPQQYGQGYAPQQQNQQFPQGQTTQYPQPQQGPNEGGGFNQPTKFGPPVTPPGSSPSTSQPPSTPQSPSTPQPQSTLYAPQQGQFYQQPSSSEGEQKPGTPPGGFGQPS
ncbi:DUF5336 domain-containing protein [Amycolatopsis sp. CA-230715]|uniref:DUF5336 domain-containing protein n=1 Tax=Amycolatopsis sp. CA-230715 TaxID=2745196 RepID=UPI001C02F441|nr:DUF5336 domain-containing protein [Amycolatopsis sp. CA-230715]QWF79548.1 hypothetical protein HUW46_02956 [Amycolatopsis sp. CA-230715]